MIYTICKLACALWALIFHPFNLKGSTNIPKHGRAILVANHTSNWDPLFISFLTYRYVHYVGKIELFKNPILAWLFTQAKVIPIDRKNVKPRALMNCMKVLKDNHILGIFPEGTRIRAGKESKISDGFVLFALRTQSPIIPIHIIGNAHIWSDLDIVVGDPIDLSEYYGKRVSDEKLSEIAKNIMDKLYLLK